ncbi:MAG: hypothetical protein AB8B80_10615 [Marinicellaceae bacterium]
MHFKKSHLAIVTVLLVFSSMTLAETKELTQLEIKQKTDALMNQSQEGLELKVLSDGTEYVDLQGRFQMFSKVKIVDGKKVFVCNTHPTVDMTNHTHEVKSNNYPTLKRASK